MQYPHENVDIENFPTVGKQLQYPNENVEIKNFPTVLCAPAHLFSFSLLFDASFDESY